MEHSGDLRIELFAASPFCATVASTRRSVFRVHSPGTSLELLDLPGPEIPFSAPFEPIDVTASICKPDRSNESHEIDEKKPPEVGCSHQRLRKH